MWGGCEFDAEYEDGDASRQSDTKGDAKVDAARSIGRYIPMFSRPGNASGTIALTVVAVLDVQGRVHNQASLSKGPAEKASTVVACW